MMCMALTCRISLNQLESGKLISTILSLHVYMKWICIYCSKVMDKDSFIDVLEEGMEDDEYHSWRRVTD